MKVFYDSFETVEREEKHNDKNEQTNARADTFSKKNNQNN